MISKRLVDSAKVVVGLAPILPSTSTPDYVSLKDFGHFTAIITVDNGTTVTGSAITLKQATAVAGTSEKALAFTKVWKNEDVATSDTLVETAVTSNTFTTVATNTLNSVYVIEVDAAELDTSNGFDCIRVGTGDATAAVVSVVYVLSNPRYAGAALAAQAAITD